jgi:hypothetical protein
MGWWRNLRSGAELLKEHQQAAAQTAPRWARVVRVGHRSLGMVSVEAEIHYGQTPPHAEAALVSVPPGMQLQAGQDLFVVRADTSSENSHTTWILDATRPPQYGGWPTLPELLQDAPPEAARPAAAPRR